MAKLDTEMWIWYSITLVVVIFRMYVHVKLEDDQVLIRHRTSRRMLLGSFKGLLADDYLMALTMVSSSLLSQLNKF